MTVSVPLEVCTDCHMNINKTVINFASGMGLVMQHTFWISFATAVTLRKEIVDEHWCLVSLYLLLKKVNKDQSEC